MASPRIGRARVDSLTSVALCARIARSPATPDSARGWDVLLLTEYADSAAYTTRETTFREIFVSPRYLAAAVTGGRPSVQLRAFVASEVMMGSVAAFPP